MLTNNFENFNLKGTINVNDRKENVFTFKIELILKNRIEKTENRSEETVWLNALEVGDKITFCLRFYDNIQNHADRSFL